MPTRSSFVVVVVVVLASLAAVDVEGLAIDNEVAGTPTITCSENAITFSARTRNLFRGNIYIKGQFGVPQCRQEYGNNDYNGASFSVRIGDCGMRRIRQLQPHGMNYMIVFVTNFHPQFVTKVDRAYNVRCFYAQQDRTVSAQLDLSMIPTQSLEQSTMLMPNCEYSVRQGTLNGQRVRFAQVGDRLVHRWECDNPNFGMLVKNCFVTDGSGSSVRVLDTRGEFLWKADDSMSSPCFERIQCPVFTPVIQGTLQYDNSLNLAFVEVWAYKFPDRPQLYFQCQIQVCNKRDNECVGVTPPNCPNIPRSRFQPNTVVNRGTDPVRVRGTFQPDTLVPIVPNTDPYVRGVQISRGAQPSSRFVDEKSVIGRPRDVGGRGGDSAAAASADGNSVGNGGGPQNFGTHQLVRNDPADNGVPAGIRQARQFYDRPVGEKPKPKRYKRSPSTGRVEIWRQMTDRKVEEEVEDEEVEGEVLDVIAPPVFIADREDDPDDDPVSPFGSSPAVCINQFGVGLLMFSFVFLLLVLFCLLFHSLRLRHQRGKFNKKMGQSTTPTALSVVGGSSPVGLLTTTREK